jgi:hypothetical protein
MPPPTIAILSVIGIEGRAESGNSDLLEVPIRAAVAYVDANDPCIWC